MSAGMYLAHARLGAVLACRVVFRDVLVCVCVPRVCVRRYRESGHACVEWWPRDIFWDPFFIVYSEVPWSPPTYMHMHMHMCMCMRAHVHVHVLYLLCLPHSVTTLHFNVYKLYAERKT